LAGVRAALATGVDGIEFDIWYTRDHEMIVIHDDKLGRTTNGGDVPVGSKTLAELRQLDAGNWGPWAGSQFAGEKLPTPQEFIHQVLAGGAFPVVHIKEGSLVPDVMRILAQEKNGRRAVIFCFEYDAMRVLAQKYPGKARKGWLIDEQQLKHDGIQGVIAKAAQVQCDALAPEAGIVTPALIQASHAAQIPVWVWTVDAPKQMGQLLDMGVDGIITNDSPALNAVLTQHGISKSGGTSPGIAKPVKN
jgi:glycerophosphoryl diester phosphodiesterase